ncbi:MAG: substrate-binding domain-containing protein [Proteobacteria bacterium]|nr:substrate-binding domain-containing protein [Pseudomonadota bacterium]
MNAMHGLFRHLGAVLVGMRSALWVVFTASAVFSEASASPSNPETKTPTDWSVAGRPLPVPEFLQPQLDAELPAYRPCSREPLQGRIQGSVPAILPDLFQRWAQAFQQRHPGVVVDAPPPYLPPQGALNPAMRRFLAGEGDFAFVSRDLAYADVAAYRRGHGQDVKPIAVAGGSWRHFGFIDTVAVVVHESNPLRAMSLAQLDALFSSSRLRGHHPVRTWGDLGVAEWADKPVRVVGAAAWSSAEPSARAIAIRRVAMDHAGSEGRWRKDVPVDSKEADVPDIVARDPYAIGFTGLGHMVPQIRALALIQSDGGGRPVPPDYESVARGQYPLARFAYVLSAAKPSPIMREFLRFVLSKDGQEIVSEQGIFLPLRALQASEGLRLIDSGATQLGCSARP